MIDKNLMYTKHDLNTYDYYYRLCRENYFNDYPEHKNLKNNLSDLKLNFFSLDKADSKIFTLDNDYKALIKEMSLIVEAALDYGRNTICTKHLDGHELSSVHSFDKTFHKLLSKLMPSINREFAGSYCRPWYVSASRSILRQPLPDDNGTTWQWHSDMTPLSAFKLFFYLTDVDENSAPFTYLLDPDGNPVYRPGSKYWTYISNSGAQHKALNPAQGSTSRIPIAEINKLKSIGYTEKEVHMPAGSFMVWNPNYVHKATIPKKRVRDVLQVQLRPVLKKPESFWLGSNAQTHAHSQHSFDWWAYD